MSVITKCPRHGFKATAHVCGLCYKDAENMIDKLSDALTSAPALIDELFAEGTLYKNTLRKIASALCSCDNERERHEDDCVVSAAKDALNGCSLKPLARKGGLLKLTIDKPRLV